MKNIFMIMLLFTFCTIVSCNKSANDLSPLHSDSLQRVSANSFSKISLQNNWIEYRIATSYENNYAHWCQLWASPLSTYEKQNSCGPTCYMIAAHMISAGNNMSFMPSSGSKLMSIIQHIGSLPISITQIGSYVSSYDQPPLNMNSYSGSNRTAFKNFLESSLSEGNPVIVPIVITTTSSRVNDVRYTSESQTSNYDIDSSPLPDRSNYILTSKVDGGYGHFVVVIAIRIFTLTGNGLVFYKDPLASAGTTKVCSYSRFLESAKINGSCTEPNCINYDAICIKKQ